MKLVVAEKPSVAMSYAKVLGATSRQDGYLEGNGYLVSWCVGHLVELGPPCSNPSGPDIKRKLRAEGHGAASSRVDIPTGWDPRAKQQPTGLIAYQLTLAALFESLRP